MIQPRLEEKRLAPELMLHDLDGFMSKVDALAQMIGIKVHSMQADHIALRINDFETTKAAHGAWKPYGKIISQAQINGRPIVVLHFAQPVQSHGWEIECLELPYPAEGKIYTTEGWEHAEFVVNSLAQTADELLTELKDSFTEFAERFEQLDSMGVKVKLSSPKGEGERLNNPTVAFKYQGVCIKFHPHSLKAIVESEHG